MDEEKYFERIAEYKLLAKHEVGQNFLIDPSVCEKIVSLLELKENEQALEIGCGAGSLSFFLAKSKAESTLIDIDEGLIVKLQEDFSSCPNVKVLQANALRFDFSPFDKIVGNLPYYITSSLLEAILLKATKCQRAVLMVQKEVFPRLNSKPKQEGYGPLAILIAYRASIKREFNVPRSSFAPMPHVDSTVFSLSFKKEADGGIAQALYSLTSALFLHRRKTIYNNLSSYLKDEEMAKVILSACSIMPNKRPEEIGLNDYLALLEHCSQKENGPKDCAMKRQFD